MGAEQGLHRDGEVRAVVRGVAHKMSWRPSSAIHTWKRPVTGRRLGEPNRRIRVIRTPPARTFPAMAAAVDPNYTVLEAALIYARHGLRVLPCWSTGSKQKSPHLPNGFHGATTVGPQIRRWWRAWPDALIGLVIPDDIVVLDIDPRNGGSRQALEAALGQLPDTLTVWSGRNDGGCHLYFARKVGLPLRGHVPGARGLDVKTNGYMIAPPSPHPDTGMPYRFDEPPGSVAMAPLPASAIDVLGRAEPSSRLMALRGSDVRGRSARHPWSATRALGLAYVVRKEVVHNRNNILYWAACRVVEEAPLVVRRQSLKLLADAAMAAGLTRDAVEATLGSAMRHARTTPQEGEAQWEK